MIVNLPFDKQEDYKTNQANEVALCLRPLVLSRINASLKVIGR